MRHYEQVAQAFDDGIPEDAISKLVNIPLDEVKLIVSNVRIENKMRADGAKMFEERQRKLDDRGQALDKDTSIKALRDLMKPASMAIIDSLNVPSKGRTHIAVKTLRDKDPFTLALITTRYILMGVTSDRAALTALCERVCMAIEPELGVEERFRVGLWLVRIVCNNSNGHFEITKRPQGQHLVYFVDATDAFHEWESQHTELLKEMAVMYRPMVVPPKPWTGTHDGGFYDKRLQQPFVRNNKRANNRTHGPQAIPKVFEAVNKIQATPFKINSRVLEVANHLRERETLYFKGYYEYLPTVDEFSDIPITHTMRQLYPEIKTLEETLGITTQARKKYGKGFGTWVKRLIKRIKKGHPQYDIKVTLENLRHQRHILTNHKKLIDSRTSKNRVVSTALETANDYVAYDSLYMPCNLDWRSRVYPITAGLTTQGTSLQKALLKFAQGKPLSASSNPAEALDWLKVHVANCYGLDKQSWQARIAWAEENSTLITQVGTEPLKYLELWTGDEVDCPWLFLAACEQVCKVYDEGLEAIIDIPIPMDGTCNGAQHYAAMARDTKGAFGVNVAPVGTEGLSERLKSLRGKLGNPKVTIEDQRINSHMNKEVIKVIENA